MRDFKGMKRQRGRNRGGGQSQGGGGKPQHNINRAFDSNGPDNIKVRGNAQHVYEKYQQLARDATLAGDRVLAENHLQHAEHYFRTLRAIQPTRAASEIVSRETASNYDIDFEDEAVETAMEEADAQAAARAVDVQNQPQAMAGDASDGQAGGGEPRFDQGQGQGQRREWRDRPQGEFRDRQDRPFNDRGDRQDRPQGEFRQAQQAPQGEFRDRQNGSQDRGQNGGDRPRFRDRDDRFRDRPEREVRTDGGERQDRSQGEVRSQGQTGEVRDRQNGGQDRTQPDRGDRPRFRERDDRRFEPRDGQAQASADAPPVSEQLRGEPASAMAPTQAREEPASVLRSEDGGVSQLPGFLQVPAAASPVAPADEADRPRRPRRRRTREDGDAAPAPEPQVEDA